MRVVDKLRFALFPWRTCSGFLRLPAEEPHAAKSKTTHSALFVNEERTGPVTTQRRLDEDLLFHFDVAPVIERATTVVASPFQQRIESLTATEDPYLARLRHDVSQVSGRGLDEVAEYLVARDYSVVKRTVNFPNRLSMTKLKNVFLVVFRKKEDANVWGGEVEEIFVETKFQSHFDVGFDQPVFKSVTNMLPASFIAPRKTFEELAFLGATEIEKAFIRQEAMLPLWRTHRATLSKWFSEVILDEPIVHHTNKSHLMPDTTTTNKLLMNAANTPLPAAGCSTPKEAVTLSLYHPESSFSSNFVIAPS